MFPSDISHSKNNEVILTDLCSKLFMKIKCQELYNK